MSKNKFHLVVTDTGLNALKAAAHTQREATVLWLLVDQLRHHDAVISNIQIAQATGINETQVSKLLKKLLEGKFILRFEKQGLLYRLGLNQKYFRLTPISDTQEIPTELKTD